MIVRILEDGQYELDDAALDLLGPLDEALETAVSAGDEAAFSSALAQLIEEVHRKGRPLEASTIRPSDLALPAAGSTLSEVRDLLRNEETQNA